MLNEHVLCARPRAKCWGRSSDGSKGPIIDDLIIGSPLPRLPAFARLDFSSWPLSPLQSSMYAGSAPDSRDLILLFTVAPKVHNGAWHTAGVVNKDLCPWGEQETLCLLAGPAGGHPKAEHDTSLLVLELKMEHVSWSRHLLAVESEITALSLGVYIHSFSKFVKCWEY